MDQLKKTISYINSFEFVKNLLVSDIQVYLVGGAVRDGFLEKPIKDIDILVTNTTLDRLSLLLSDFGVVNLVGESFGIIKFRPFADPLEEFDIAVPRVEQKVGEGHHGFDIITTGVTIEDDMHRRDFTINSIAISIADERVFNICGGLQDLEGKLIRLTNPVAFHEDPLRMLRAIQFAARFNFIIEPVTYQAIKDNVAKISEISGERILIELEKIVSKGDTKLGCKLLLETGIWDAISGFDSTNLKQYISVGDWFDGIQTVAELVYSLSYGKDFKTLWTERLKGDLSGLHELQALEIANNDQMFHERRDHYYAFHLALKKSNQILVTQMLHPDQFSVQQDFINKVVPAGYAEIEINGQDLLDIGINGKMIGHALKISLLGIYDGEVLNNKADLLAYIKIWLHSYISNENPPI